MTTRAMLLTAVCNEPGDDVRLVFSDWLEEHGESERAEFIRLQIALAAMSVDDPRRFEAERREAELLSAHRADWLAELPAWAREDAVFRRGFVVQVHTTEKRFLDKAEELFAVTPLESVRLRRVERDLSRISASPHLARLRRLDLTGNAIARPGPLRLAQAPGACNLTELVLDENRIDDVCVSALLGSAHLPRLERLSLRRSLMWDRDVVSLASMPNAFRLRALNLRENRCGDQGLAALASSEHATNLTDLDLGSTQITTAGLAALADTPLLGRLTRLNLNTNFNNIPGGAGALAALPHRLADLDLCCTDQGDPGAIALAGSPASVHLRSLDLSLCKVGPAGATALAESTYLTGLVRLNLGHNRLGPEGAAALARSPHLNRLIALDVTICGVTPAAAGLLRERFGQRVRL